MSVRTSFPRGLVPYIAVVFLTGLGIFTACLAGTPWAELTATVPLWSVAVLIAMAIASEFRPIILQVTGLEGRSLAISAPFVLALVPIAGPAVAMIAQVSTTLVSDLQRRTAPHKTLFNLGHDVIDVTVAAIVFSALTGTDLLTPTDVIDTRAMLALLVAGVAMVAANEIMLSTVVALATSRSAWAIVKQDFGFLAVTQAVLLCVSGVAAFVARDSVVALILLTAPMGAAYLYAWMGAKHATEARQDQLTGLGNRGRLHDDLQAALDGASRNGDADTGLVLLDLDNFKDFNDALGHPVGDAILREVAARLRATAPDTASVHRLGGDEFAVVVSGGLAETRRVAHSLLDAFRSPVGVDALELLVRGSAGIAVAPLHGADVDTLMKNADIALYHAKLERDRVSVYSSEFAVNTVERLQLLVDLRAALESASLTVAYQPQIDLATGRIVGIEALARWTHPVRGTVGPDEFVPLAENSGLIFALTDAVLDRALADLATLRASGHDLRVAVNLSARHLSDMSVLAMVRSALDRHGVPPCALVLEVTETAIFTDPSRADAVLRSLRDLGVAIAIDDYGTGNASLNYLRRLKIDELKIDRSFVRTMGEDPHDLIIVSSTVELALALGLRVVAEGIEDAATGDAIRLLGDVIGQGYHYGRPVPFDALRTRIEAGCEEFAPRATQERV